MKLKVLLPFQVFTEKTKVSRIVAETRAGSVELLPRRFDCVAALAPGILTYETPNDGTAYLAVDEGVLIKAGTQVLVSVRHAIGGVDLSELHGAVQCAFLTPDEREKNVRTAVAKIEGGFLRRLGNSQRERARGASHRERSNGLEPTKKNEQRTQFLNRSSILKLLSDEEIARVSLAETLTQLSDGDEYLDLGDIELGVRRAIGTSTPMRRVLPRKAVHEATWDDILVQLAAS